MMRSRETLVADAVKAKLEFERYIVGLKDRANMPTVDNRLSKNEALDLLMHAAKSGTADSFDIAAAMRARWS
jgi:hypothetical protein